MDAGICSECLDESLTTVLPCPLSGHARHRLAHTSDSLAYHGVWRDGKLVVRRNQVSTQGREQRG